MELTDKGINAYVQVLKNQREAAMDEVASMAALLAQAKEQLDQLQARLKELEAKPPLEVVK